MNLKGVSSASPSEDSTRSRRPSKSTTSTKGDTVQVNNETLWDVTDAAAPVIGVRPVILDRWAVERAVLASALPSQARLIVFVLLTHVSQGTLVVPPKYAPSFSTLVQETGLSRGTVSTYLNQLEADGWVDRQRPTTKEALASRAKTGYRLMVPPSALVQEMDPFNTRTSSGAERVTTEDQVGTRTAGEPVQGVDVTSSAPELRSNVSPTSSSPTEKKGGSGGNTSTPKPKRRIATPVPDIFAVTDDMRSWATSKGIAVDLNFETEQFLNKHRAKGNTFVDWIAAWRTWMNNAQKWSQPANQRAGTGTTGRSPGSNTKQFTEEDYRAGWKKP